MGGMTANAAEVGHWSEPNPVCVGNSMSNQARPAGGRVTVVGVWLVRIVVVVRGWPLALRSWRPGKPPSVQVVAEMLVNTYVIPNDPAAPPPEWAGSVARLSCDV